MFLCAPILRESNKHVCFEESPYQEWHKVKKGKIVLYISPRARMPEKSAICLNPLQYGIHGLWLGGACLAIAFGILDRIIMCHIGRIN